MMWLLILVGGGLGAVGRFLMSRMNREFPYGTLAANSIASLVIGYLYPELMSGNPRAFLIAGFCGSLSTISTFALEMNTKPKPIRYLLLTWLVPLSLLIIGYGLSQI